MIFSSIEFIYVFLPAVLVAFFTARLLLGRTAGLVVLTLASFGFYSHWRLDYLWILLGSILVNYGLSRFLAPGTRRNVPILLLAVAANLGLLFWFKYAPFASGILNQLGLTNVSFTEQALPLGISFFTFQQIAYLVDCARGQAPRHSLLRHAVFVSFFPQLIAGPIVHHSEMMPQLEHSHVSLDRFREGLLVFAIGLFKKVVIADSLAELATAGFADPASLAVVNAWATVLAYTFQLYFDFSGYSDMAVGLGLMFGVKLPWNFLSPYRASSVAAFWRRWHITLSNFLKHYVYIPLGGSRQRHARTVANLLLTMLLGGIWHGAGWTFVAWGLLHGAALAANHTWKQLGIRLPRMIGWVLTIFVVVLGWVLFRAESYSDAMVMYARLFGGADLLFQPYDLPLLRAAPFLLAAAVLALAAPNTAQIHRRLQSGSLGVAYASILLLIAMGVVLGRMAPPEFLYFDF